MQFIFKHLMMKNVNESVCFSICPLQKLLQYSNNDQKAHGPNLLLVFHNQSGNMHINKHQSSLIYTVCPPHCARMPFTHSPSASHRFQEAITWEPPTGFFRSLFNLIVENLSAETQQQPHKDKAPSSCRSHFLEG